MKINKKLMAIMMTLAIGGALVGCGKTETPPVTPPTEDVAPEVAPEVTPDEGENEETEASALEGFVTTITDGVELPMQGPMSAEMFADAYGIDTNLLSDYYISMPMMNVHATEIAVFELKDAKDADTIMEGIEKRQKGLEEQWQSYLPDQLELVQNYKTVVKDNMILFVISHDADKIVENFNNALNQ